MVRLDLRGRMVTLPAREVEAARDLAAAAAGTSSRSRDLALVLDWSLGSRRVVALRRSEAQELERLVRRYPALAGLSAVLDARDAA